MNPQIEALANKMIEAIKGHVARAAAVLSERLTALEKRIGEIPAGPKGEPGQHGEKGADGLPGKDGIDGKDGLPGQDGEKSVDGLPGKDGLNGKDGESVHPDTVKVWLFEMVDKAIAALPKTKDGENGRDALALDILPMIDETKSYPRGTFAEHRGGIIRALRNTDPVTDGLAKAGWLVCMNGITAEIEETLDEGRTIKRTTHYTDGRELVREIKTSAILYRGIWREAAFDAGDVTTWGGSAWHCQEKTSDKPGTSAAWKLMVKEGARGKDFRPNAEPAVGAPVHLK